MGFFSRLFRRKNSPNYEISCSALTYVFYHLDFPLEEFYDNLGLARNLLNIALKCSLENGVRPPRKYRELPIAFVTNAEKTRYGYIVSFNDAKVECECNFVAMMIENGEKVYYTNEFYKTVGRFGLCIWNEDGRHFFGLGTPQSYEEFKNCVLGKASN